ncbi:sugar phosphate isomerase/epimerase family protein [Maritalea sp.]|uniref:sugar phosphate isomerase/epimerase family protein n=1 Tax=Maritalea sp. TaxID=2003361 RepID=UPI003EF12951
MSNIGFSIGHFGQQGDLDALSRKIGTLVEMGASICELNASSLDVVSDCRLMPQRVVALRSALGQHKTAYSLHAPIAINLMDETHIDLHMRAAHASLDLADACGSNIVVMHPGRTHPGVWVDRAAELLRREAEKLARLAERAQQLGLVIAYENLNPNRHNIAGTETSYALDLNALAQQVKTVDHPALKVCFDVSHAMQGAVLQGYDLLDQLPNLAPFICHIHFSDATGIPATIQWNNDGERLFFGIGDMHAAPGFGLLDFDAIADALDVRHAPNIVIELKENHFLHSGQHAFDVAQHFAKRLANKQSPPHQ